MWRRCRHRLSNIFFVLFYRSLSILNELENHMQSMNELSCTNVVLARVHCTLWSGLIFSLERVIFFDVLAALLLLPAHNHSKALNNTIASIQQRKKTNERRKKKRKVESYLRVRMSEIKPKFVYLYHFFTFGEELAKKLPFSNGTFEMCSVHAYDC